MAQDDLVSELPDLTRMALGSLLTLDSSVFGQALRRVADEAVNPSDVVAGFEASI